MCGDGRHAVVFEAAGGIESFILQEQVTVIEADVSSDGIGLLQNRLPFADGDHFLFGCKGKQFPKPPHPAEIERITPIGPAVLKLFERRRHRQTVPIVIHVQQTSAIGAGRQNLINRK